MAARRVASSSINWTAFAERVPQNQRSQFLNFKSKSDGYLRKVLANPAEPPKIDFAAYKGKVAVAGLVESFQKSYEALKVPYPTENLTPQIEAQRKEQHVVIKKFVEDSKKRIAEYEAKVAEYDKIIPYEEMTIQEYAYYHNERVVDPFHPTYWPHTAEVQPDYEESVPEGADVAVAKH